MKWPQRRGCEAAFWEAEGGVLKREKNVGGRILVLELLLLILILILILMGSEDEEGERD